MGPRDVPRASPSGHLSGLGKSLGRRGCTTQYIPPLGSDVYNTPKVWWSTDILLIINPSTRWIRKSIPVGREGLTVLKSILPCRWWEYGDCYRIFELCKLVSSSEHAMLTSMVWWLQMPLSVNFDSRKIRRNWLWQIHCIIILLLHIALTN